MSQGPIESAGSVIAAGERGALVTGLSLPALTTSEKRQKIIKIKRLFLSD